MYEYHFGQSVTIDQSRAQFWANFAETDDSKGGLEVPDAWKIQYLAEDGSWKDVEPTEDYTVVRNSPASRADTDAKGWSAVTFKPVTTKSLRLVLTPYTGSSTFGAAVAEWGVHGIDGTEPYLPRSTRPRSSRLLTQPTASMQAATPPLHGLSSSKSLTLPTLCTTMSMPPKNRSPSR